MLTYEIMKKAFYSRDTSYDGQFFVAVKSTGIFCKPSCRAKKPKEENIEFFRTVKEAVDHGYRPCKICHPTRLPGEHPEWVRRLLDRVEANPFQNIKESDLIDMGLEPNTVRRYFKKHFGMTFKAYCRALRISQAFDQIKDGDSTLGAALDAGYESLSGFAYAFRKLTGGAPGKATARTQIKIKRIATPIGPMLAGATDRGICLFEFADRKMLETQLNRLVKYYNACLIPGISPLFRQLEKEINEYFEGKRKQFTVPLDLKGTPFQLKIWEILQEIPYGQTRSYADQARRLGNPGAVRAVARANGDNRIAIIIPCHRVIGSDGKLVGYGGGLHRKQFLLELESKYS